MLTAIIKLIDIAGRSLFVLIALYSLPVRYSGQFGIILTLIGLFCFLSGFERYVDLQRVLVGKAEKEVSQLIFSVLFFFGANYLLWVPVLAFFLYSWAGISALPIILCLVIAIGDHLSNEFYRIALITHKYRNLLLVAMFKNAILLGIVSYGILVSPRPYDLNQILIIWAVLSLVGLFISVVVFIDVGPSLQELLRCEGHIPLLDQYRRSSTHFKVGLLAVLSLQADRLVAGSLLTLEDLGIYFRHIFLVLSVYQVLGIICFNRVIVKVYGSLRSKDIDAAKSLISRERQIYVVLTLCMIVLACSIKLLPIGSYSAVQVLVPSYVILLLFAYLIRGIADFNAMILNALYLERMVFRVHLIVVSFSIALSVVMTLQFGLVGLMATVLVAASIYLVISHLFASRALSLVKRSAE